MRDQGEGPRAGPEASGALRVRVPAWDFLSNHAHVLLVAAAEPESRVRDVAARVGITDRAVQRIMADLVASRYLERERVGRRNRYRIHPELSMRHPLVAHNEVSVLLELFQPGRQQRPLTPQSTRQARHAGMKAD